MKNQPTKYWIEYTDGTTSYFTARTPEEAFRYFMQEGDHALDYGKVISDSGKKPHRK